MAIIPFLKKPSYSENDLDSVGETDDEQSGSSDIEQEIVPTVASDSLSEDDHGA